MSTAGRRLACLKTRCSDLTALWLVFFKPSWKLWVSSETRLGSCATERSSLRGGTLKLLCLPRLKVETPEAGQEYEFGTCTYSSFDYNFKLGARPSDNVS